jgi:hypothetical protein
MSDVSDLVPIPEVAAFSEATVVNDRLVATTEDGRRVAFAFEVNGDDPGPVQLDPDRLERIEDPRPDEWLQALVTHPVSAAWLGGIKSEHPAAFDRWFEQRGYEEGGEEGAG